MRINCFFQASCRNSDTAVGFGDSDFLSGTDILVGIYRVTLTSDPLTLNTCSVSAVTSSISVPNFSDIEQSAAALVRYSDLKISYLGAVRYLGFDQNWILTISRHCTPHCTSVSTFSSIAWFGACYRLVYLGERYPKFPTLISQSWLNRTRPNSFKNAGSQRSKVGQISHFLTHAKLMEE